jgi:single-strand DNA-binding protein
MGSLNKVLLIGHLGRDPEARATAGGTKVSSFSVATNFTRNTNGTAEELTEWHRIVAYGRLAETCTGYLHKGRLVCVEGSLHTRSWEKTPGQKHYTTEVVASRVTFLGPKSGDHGSSEPAESDPEPEF